MVSVNTDGDHNISGLFRSSWSDSKNKERGNPIVGFYLNSKKARSNYQEIVNSAYFVDKTLLLKELIPIVGQGNTTGQSNKYGHRIFCKRCGQPQPV